jgi:hypothetical protein
MYLGSLMGAIPAWRTRMVVRTPTVSESYRWKTFPLHSFGADPVTDDRKGWVRHFFFRFLPAMLPIAAGYLDLCGPRPRTPGEMEQMADSKLSMYVRSRCGILQPETADSSDTDGDVTGFGIAGPGWRGVAGMFAGYAGRVFRSCLPGVPPLAQGRNSE